MKVYIGQTRSKKLIARLNDMGFGEMTVRGECPPRRTPWALDNGAYRDWTAGKKFDAAKWNDTMTWLLLNKEHRPDFIVAPDIVAGGVASLKFSLPHALAMRFIAPVYLAVQDGMDRIDVARTVDTYDGIFVGGSLDWKIKTGHEWVRFAHRFGKPCHIGRVGTADRVAWARRIGADSVDSCLPLFSEDNLRNFLRGLNAQQLEMGLATPGYELEGTGC